MLKRKLTSGFLALTLVLSMLSVTSFANAPEGTEAAQPQSEGQIKNIIFMIPDGGGDTLMDLADMVKQAGGFIIQLMPFAEDAVIEKLEENLSKISSVTSVLDQGKTPEEMLELLLDGMDVEILDTIPTEFYCNCDKKRIEKALISVGQRDLKEMIDDGKEIEVKCHFCNSAYKFSVDELKELLKKAKR